MRVGVITTQYSPNFGALLQTFALQTFLRSIDDVKSVEVIDYYPIHARHFWSVYNHQKNLKDLVHNIYLFFHQKIVQTRKKQFELFNVFIKEHIKCSKRYSAETIEETKECYDAFICGSDQIWNLTRHDDPIWFLYFTKGWAEKIKFSYAPSVADAVPVQCYENVKKYIDNLDLVSVRERSDVEQLKYITGRKIFHACDPVFLLTPHEWEKFIPERKILKPYILCYFISSGDYAVSVVKKIKKMTGLEVVHVNVNARDRFDSDLDIRNSTPFEFISYIKNATYVCTNSFHCTAFSLIFKKNFIVVPKKTANSRMESLMQKANIGNRFIYPNQLPNLLESDLAVDYSQSNLNEWIENSKKFILKGLKIDG